jgi:U3 small nucleolar RNA-associated protein 3
MGDAPEELYRGGVAKKGKTARFEEALERDEMEAFKRVSMTTKEKKVLRNRNFEEM